MIFNLKPGAGDGPVDSIAEDFEEPTTINGVRFPGIQWLAADKSPGSRIQGWQAIRSRLNAAVPDKNDTREKAGLFACEGVRSFFDHVIVLPRDLKNNKEDIPDKMNDHSADCTRCRLQHNTNRLSASSGVGSLNCRQWPLAIARRGYGSARLWGRLACAYSSKVD